MSGAEQTCDTGRGASSPAGPVPSHDARALTGGGPVAEIKLEDQCYTLRITRAGKLILTK